MAFFCALEPAPVMLPVAQAAPPIVPAAPVPDAPGVAVVELLSEPQALRASAPVSTRPVRAPVREIVTWVPPEVGWPVLQPLRRTLGTTGGRAPRDG